MNNKNTSLRNTLSTILVTIGLLAIMTAAFLPLVHMGGSYNRYIYAAGAIALLEGLRLRRLLRVEIWTALIFVVGAVFLFLPSAGATDWIAFTIAGGVLTVYTSIMIPRIKK